MAIQLPTPGDLANAASVSNPASQMTSPVFNVPMGAPSGQTPSNFQGVPGGDAATLSPQHFVENNPRHMGASGTIHDILGTLGDFLLTRLHMPAMYAPAQQRRRDAEAGANYDADPIGAIQQTLDVDPARSQAMRSEHETEQYKNAMVAQTGEYRQAREQSMQDATRSKAVNYAANMMNTLKDPNDYTTYRNAIMNNPYLKNDPDGQAMLGNLYPTTYDPVRVTSAIGGSVPVSKQWADTLANSRLSSQNDHYDRSQDHKEDHDSVMENQGQQNADSRTTMAGAAVQRAGQGRNPTLAATVSSLLDSGQTLSRGQQAIVNKYINGTNKPVAGTDFSQVEGKVVVQPNGSRFLIKNGKPFSLPQ